jgi:5-methylcytosine-specific restriction endonuclease McrA
MKPERVTPAQRQAVWARARGRCEYCHTPDGFVPGSFAVEHIVPQSKGGRTRLDNLALSCPAYNGHKYNKVEGTDPLNRSLVPLFNPRKQRWAEHFVWSDDFTLLIGLTPTGRATVVTLQMNHQKMVNLRRLLGLAGLHP